MFRLICVRKVSVALTFAGFALAGFSAFAADPPPALFKKLDAGDMAPLSDKQKKILDATKHQAATQSVEFIQINPAALDQPALTIGQIADQPVQVTRSAIAGAAKNVWAGRLHASPQDVFLSTTGGNTYGRIATKQDLYLIKPLGNGLHVLVKQDPKKMPTEHAPDNKEGARIKEAPPAAQNKAQGPQANAAVPKAVAASVKSDVAAPAVPATPPVIDVLVAYTPAVEALHVDIDGFIKAAVDATNGAYRNSKINMTMNLVKTVQVMYTESGTFDTDVARLAGKMDGFIDDIHSLRDSVKADVVVMLIENHNFCGLADAIQATADTAFACVDHTCAVDNLSFAHEVGHLQGARHNPEVDNTGPPFPFGHGLLMSDGVSRTVMAYDDGTGRIRLPYFSNPDVSANGVPTGTSILNDNARVLNQTAAAVSRFRP